MCLPAPKFHLIQSRWSLSLYLAQGLAQTKPLRLSFRGCPQFCTRLGRYCQQADLTHLSHRTKSYWFPCNRLSNVGVLSQEPSRSHNCSYRRLRLWARSIHIAGLLSSLSFQAHAQKMEASLEFGARLLLSIFGQGNLQRKTKQICLFECQANLQVVDAASAL